MNVLLGVTGSVAATLYPKLRDALIAAGHDVKVILTEKSKYFISVYDYEDGSTIFSQDVSHVYTDELDGIYQ